jgi:hypothetical protein
VRYLADTIEKDDTGNNAEELSERAYRVRIFMQLREEISDRDVEEVSRSERQEVGLDPFDTLREKEDEEHTDECGESREEIEEDRAVLPKSAVDEHGEVSDLLWDLVEDDGDCRRDSQMRIDEEARCNEHTIHHVVRTITDENEWPNRMHVLLTIGEVTVMPVNELFDRKREEDADKDEYSRLFKIPILSNFGEQMKKNVSEECTNRKRHK